MLLFRSERHVARWCEQWQRPRGGTLDLALAWELVAERSSDDPGFATEALDALRLHYA